MATIHHDAAGNILRVLQRDEEERQFPDPPPNTAGTITFDHDTNAGVIAALNSDWNSHRVSGGKLQRNNVDVVIAPDGAAKQDRADFAGNVQAAITRLGQIKTQADGGLSNAQRDVAIGDLAVILRRTLKRLAQLNQLKGA